MYNIYIRKKVKKLDYTSIFNTFIICIALVVIIKIIFDYLTFRKDCDLNFAKFKYKMDNFEECIDERENLPSISEYMPDLWHWKISSTPNSEPEIREIQDPEDKIYNFDK